MKKLLVVFLLGCALYGYIDTHPGVIRTITGPATAGGRSLATAYEHRQSNIQVSGSGRVVRMLADDNNGSRHQKFIIRLASGQTVLVAHNIDLAPRIDGLREGDTVEFFGEYEWNAKGGVVHWTHHDPNGYHESGWVRHKGRVYQ